MLEEALKDAPEGKLAKKKYMELELEDTRKEEKMLKNYINFRENNPSQAENLLENSKYIPLLKDELVDISEEMIRWKEEEFLSNPYYPENLLHRGISGNMLRSKSEAMIDSILFKAGIPFRYECQMVVGNHIYYPDFTCRHPRTGKLVIWERFGMMDELAYARKAYEKIEAYGFAGFYPGINLILTSETEESPFNFRQAELIVEEYFS